MTVDTSETMIVVGVDGSPSSKAALRWAAGQAARTGATVHAVTAWEIPYLYGWGPEYPYQDFEAAARVMLAETVKAALGLAPAVPVRQSVVAGHPVQVLLDAARGAQALVVGGRGNRGCAGALLGSVAGRCAHHAECPLVVVRPPGGEHSPVPSPGPEIPPARRGHRDHRPWSEPSRTPGMVVGEGRHSHDSHNDGATGTAHYG